MSRLGGASGIEITGSWKERLEELNVRGTTSNLTPEEIRAKECLQIGGFIISAVKNSDKEDLKSPKCLNIEKFINDSGKDSYKVRLECDSGLRLNVLLLKTVMDRICKNNNYEAVTQKITSVYEEAVSVNLSPAVQPPRVPVTNYERRLLLGLGTKPEIRSPLYKASGPESFLKTTKSNRLVFGHQTAV